MDFGNGLFTMTEQINKYELNHIDYAKVLMYACEFLSRHIACDIPVTDELIKQACDLGLQFFMGDTKER